MPLVSIVVPVFKSEALIKRCIESVQSQDLTDWELVLVIDGSPDNSYKVICELAEKDPRIHVFNYAENHGTMVARYNGFMKALGSYITFLDSDDWLPRDALSNLLNKALKTNSDIVCGNFAVVNEKGEQTPWHVNRLLYGDDRIGAFRAALNKDIYQTLCAKLIRREIFQTHEYTVFEHCTNAEDAGILFQVISHINKIAVYDGIVYYYFINTESSTHSVSIDSLESICKNVVLRENVLSAYPELGQDVNRYFTNNLFPLLEYSSFRSIAKKYNLQKYLSARTILKVVPLKSVFTVIAKKTRNRLRDLFSV